MGREDNLRKIREGYRKAEDRTDRIVTIFGEELIKLAKEPGTVVVAALVIIALVAVIFL